MSRVIGLTGRKRAGKDTVGGYLYHEVHAHLDAFAAPMKAALATIFNVPVTLFDDPEMKEIPLVQLLGRSPRHVMQTLGTEWGRTYVQHDMWARLLHSRVSEQVRARRSHIVVTDVRYDDEAQMLLDNGGEIWEVNRDKVLGPCVDGHSSERGVSSHLITHTLDNNGDIDALFAQIAVLLRGPDASKAL